MSNNLEELTKLPTESILFDMNFTERLVSTEVITSISNTVQTNMGRVSGSTELILGSTVYSGNIAQLRISAGTEGEQYEIAITITTSLSNIHIGKGLLRVE